METMNRIKPSVMLLTVEAGCNVSWPCTLDTQQMALPRRWAQCLSRWEGQSGIVKQT